MVRRERRPKATRGAPRRREERVATVPAQPSRAKPSRVRPSRAKRSQAKPSQAGAGARGPPKRKVDAAVRRAAILDAALTVFAERGYEAARLEDVAAKAGVAKGTLYLYFKDKEALFEALVRSAVAPIMARVSEAAIAPGTRAADVLGLFFGMFEKEVLGTRRKLLLRLIMTEGPRFPAIARFYYREVVSRGLALMQTLAERATERGEFASDAAARFPQLIVAPLVMALIWDGLFARLQPLDVAGLLRAHQRLLAGAGGRTAP